MAEHFHTYEGQHRLWRVFGSAPGRPHVKRSDPRADVVRFDRQCFPAEEPLLIELAGLGMTRIPAVRGAGRSGGPQPRSRLVQDYIEGTTLAEVSPPGTPVASRHLRDIVERFRQLADVRVADVTTERTCSARHRAPDGDTGSFLATLLTFTRERGYDQRRARYGPLFDALAIPPTSLDSGSALYNEAKGLTPRPFCLLHGDLHRANFVVDHADGGLWTIDWELAMLGDPVYDLATHLHLMRYPEQQEAELTHRWHDAVARVLPGATDGWQQDLPHYLAYKRAQSVFTDVVRQAQKLEATAPEDLPVRLRDTAETVHALLRQAADVLRPARVPDPGDVAAAYREHVLGAPPAPAPPSAGGG
ncbi:hypothetical protein N566_27245 [Streptomycetaceae bacterium MP113-05]|nr:hypothetical protein N566_27245 [Streptomycetaceae bacterium MP113-05]